MALCQINKSIKAENLCEYQLGGIKRIAIANFDPDIKVIGQCEATEQIPEGITFGSGADGKWYEVALADESGSWTSELQNNNSIKFLVETVNGTISAVDCRVLSQWKQLTLGKFHCAIEDNQGRTWILGTTGSGLKCSTFTYNSGAGNADASGITFAFTGNSFKEPILMSEFPETEE